MAQPHAVPPVSAARGPVPPDPTSGGRLSPGTLRPAPTMLGGVGPGSVRLLPELAAAVAGSGRTRAAVVISGGFERRSWHQAMQTCLAPLDCGEFVQHGQTTPESVLRLAWQLRAAAAQLVIAIGGGTIMDTAKAAAALAPRPNLTMAAVLTACADDAERVAAAVPVLAIPTTVGTGAEVTPNATVWDRRHGRKLSLRGPGVAPRAAILDPELLADLPVRQLVYGALDSICQGAEAAWSVRSTPQSASCGLAAVAMAATALSRLSAGRGNAPPRLSLADRLELALAGNLSGQAIAETPTSSCHAVSYPLTLRHDIPHGLACGLSLGRLLRYNAGVSPTTVADPRGSDHVRTVLGEIAAAIGVPSPELAEPWLAAILARFGLPQLADVLIDPDAIATDALSYPRCSDNPRHLNQRGLARLLAEPAWAGHAG
jgi:alcohol dehydrogenase class IV